MSTRGYSDQINHALAFAGKHASGRGSGLLAQASNVALILTRYDCDEVTILAGILQHVLAGADSRSEPAMEKKVREKFGPVVAATIAEVLEHKSDDRGAGRPWEARRRDYLVRLQEAEPRALDLIAAEEIHSCGSNLADVRRLGTEYLSGLTECSAPQAVWWYGEVARVLEQHEEWPRKEMLEELRELTVALSRELGLE